MTIEVGANTTEVSVQFRFDAGYDQRLAVFGTENKMHVQVGKGLGHGRLFDVPFKIRHGIVVVKMGAPSGLAFNIMLGLVPMGFTHRFLIRPLQGQPTCWRFDF